MTSLIVQQLKILAKSTSKSMVLVGNEWQYIIIASECKHEAMQWLVKKKQVQLAFECVLISLILTFQNSRACTMNNPK